MNTQKPTALILCHDSWSEYLDRRICQQARLLAEAGYIVSLACFTKSPPESIATEQASSLDAFRRLGFNGSLLLVSYSQCRSMPDSLFGIQSQYTTLQNRKSGFVLYVAIRILRIVAHYASLSFLLPFASKLGWSLSDPLGFDAPLLDVILKAQVADATSQLSSSSLVISCDTTTARAGLFFQKRYNCSLWFDMHEYYSQQCVFPPSVQRRLLAVEKRTVLLADKTFTVNPLLAELISRDTAGQVDWLSNYLDASSLVHLHNLDSSKHSSASIDLIFHGGAGPNRNIDKLILAFNQLTDMSVHITFLQSGMDVTLLRIAERSPNIHITGYVKPQVLDAMLSNFDAIVVPYPPSDLNNTYCSPNKLGDAIAYSIPILFNSELRYLSHLAKQSAALIPLDFSSVNALAISLDGISSRLREIKQADFEVLQQAIGADSQRKLYNSWVQQSLEKN